MKAQTPNVGPGDRRAFRGRPTLRIGATSVLVAVVALLVLSPSVGAVSPTHASTTLTAPYSGTSLTFKELLTVDCASVGLSHGPKFTLSTGVGHVQANASVNSSSSCRSPILPSEAEIVGFFGFSTTNLTLSGGTRTVKSVWDLHWTVDLRASGAGSTRSNLQEAALVDFDFEIYDATTANVVNSNDWEKIVNRTGDASVHFVGSQQVTVSMSQDFNATNKYQFLAAVEFAAVAEVAQGATTGQASVGLNLATGGNGATLLSFKGV